MAERIRGAFSAIRDRISRSLQDRASRGLLLTIGILLLAGILSFWFYNRVHNFDSYKVLESVKEDDIAGTQYAFLDGKVIKYSPDGVFCVDTSNNTIWSTAYSMQTPIADVCGSTMVIAEQQGYQVYVLDSTGVQGSYTVTLPILSARVSANGVAALTLQDSDVTWINLYDTKGTLLASVKTTMDDSGYPLDCAITKDGKHLLVSFAGIKDGQLTGRIAFYDFLSASMSDDEHLTGVAEYPREIFPDVYYGSSDTPEAIGDSSYVIFKRGKKPEERAKVSFGSEIVSAFHDGENCGFIFHSDSDTEKYQMQVYSSSGKKVMETSFNFEYTGVRMENGEILIYDARNLNIYRTSGRQKLGTAYKNNVVYFTSLPGLRRYLVITGKSMDKIRLK